MNALDVVSDCHACAKDSAEPFSRRYRYAFNVCAECAPHAVNSQPCRLCAEERAEPTHRHFRFLGNSCYVCGPKIELLHVHSAAICLDSISQLDEIDAASRLAKRGEVVFVKASFGYFLVCDFEAKAASHLRAHCKDAERGLPLMARDLDVMARYCQIDKGNRDLLCLPSRPFVNLPLRNPDGHKTVASVEGTLRFSLPCTPLMHLLCMGMERPVIFLETQTAPQTEHDRNIPKNLATFATYFLWHDKPLMKRKELAAREPKATSSFSAARDEEDPRNPDAIALEACHTHIVSALMQRFHPLDEEVLAFVLDGAIASEMSSSIASEFIVAKGESCRHVARFSKPIPRFARLADRQSWHAFYAHIAGGMGRACFEMNYSELELAKFLRKQPLDDWDACSDKGEGVSSCAQLFEAMAFALGLCEEPGELDVKSVYALDGIVDSHTLENEHKSLIYPFAIPKLPGSSMPYIEPIGAWRGVLGDLIVKTPPAIISARFHLGLAQAIVRMIGKLSSRSEGRTIKKVLISCGIFENTVLLRLVKNALERQGFQIVKPIARANKTEPRTPRALQHA